MRKNYLIFLSVLLALLISLPTYAQKSISGTVKDKQGLPIPGVSVTEKNTKNGTSTNADGEFTISSSSKSILVFKSIGFANKEVTVGNQTKINITLDASYNELEEVTIRQIGYGTQKAREATASLYTVKGEQLQNRPTATIESLLQGLAPGLLVQQNTGSPGGRVNIQVRGLAAFSADANSNVVSPPLFVIDGIPIDQDPFNPSDPRQAINSVLSGLNPFDVESVDVLKDASSTAIYGSRGANGVIIITTKRGKIGKPIVTINSQYGLSYFPNLRPTLGGKAERDFKIDLYNQYKVSNVAGAVVVPGMPVQLSDSLNAFYNNSTDWQSLYFNDAAALKNINIGISGATETSNYRVGADYYDENGTVVGSGFNRYSLTYFGNFRPTPKLTITARVNANQTDASRRRGSNYNAAVIGNNFSSSFVPGPNSGFYDQFLASYSNGVNLDLTRNGIVSLEGSYDLYKFLNITTRASGNYRFYRTRNFQPSATREDSKAYSDYYDQEKLNLLSETFLRLHHTFNERHNFDFLVGNTINVSKIDYISGTGTGGPNDAQQVIKGYPQAGLELTTGNTSYGLLSYYSRLTYDYKTKYLFQTSLRGDGSSKFGKNKQWGYFPSVSAGWVFTKEDFLKGIADKWFNFGKIRASYGKVGSQFDDNYLALGAYVTGGGAGSTYNGIPTLSPNYGAANGIPLPNLSWQTATTYGVGADLEFFGSRLTASLDYYHRATDNFLFREPLNSTSGYSLHYINGGAVLNRGFDAAITGYVTAPQKKLQYTITLIGSTNTNILTKLPDGGKSVARGTGNAPYLEVGRPLNGFYLFRYLGVYPNDAAVPVDRYTGKPLFPNTSGFTSQDPYRGGDIALLDVDGNGRIDVKSNNDKIYMGDPSPKFYGSLSHSFRYLLKNNSSIQLQLFFNYSIGNKVYNQVLVDRLKSVSWTASKNVNYPNGQTNLLDVSDLDYWTPTHTNAKYPSLNPWRYYALSSYDFIGNYDVPTDLFLEDGSFIRLNSISLGYDFSPKFLAKIKIRRLRLFASMNNVFILSKYSGVDPENVDNYGYDQGNGYPIPKKFNFGFNFEF
ncbi:SusC/RagA family TonB-linked outer membrane protein [Pedobacter endophyticus]|uniref:SusC/RagA family TonB-linked outer membrane protein n=1 Tax=Pedobacter endophyticus TaxID=2789740 RepID=A0A7S9L299_9SPHI|nr:SusC/RagA family TonB-linked outer membrane protein [Pedobacter endophyticus]QPH41162.1 SusC/RagA family TonB-linked outer membrane protein [Pedobacter endophyticus]